MRQSLFDAVPDILTPDQRSRHMARIRAKDTKPEMLVRRALHRRGFRYRLHDRRLPGRPDMVFPRHRAAVLVHGCFWHGHDCPLFRLPGTRRDFWEAKIAGNRLRDARALASLQKAEWRTLVIWECAMRGRDRHPLELVIDRCADWLCSGGGAQAIRGGD